MSAPQFTPAPWRLEKHAKLGGTQMYWVNDFTSVGTQIPEDARLIAAAPELYEALEAILAEIAADHLGVLEMIENIARDTLAKARGEA